MSRGRVDSDRSRRGRPGDSPGDRLGDADRHVRELAATLPTLDVTRLERWGARLAGLLPDGGRLLAAGNGGSAAQAQHLTAELVGRFQDERPAMSAIALHADTSSLTAIGNDYGYDEVFARQVRAHGRPGDVLMLLSTSGRSANLLRAATTAGELGLTVWALLGPPRSPLAGLCHETVGVGGTTEAGIAGSRPNPSVPTSTVQEVHLVAVHLLCAAFDGALGAVRGADRAVAEDGRIAAEDGFPGHSGERPEGQRTSGARRPGPGQARRTDGDPPTAPGKGRPGSRAAGRGGHRPIVVVGDTLLDRDISGHAARLAPDAPVPVLDGLDVTERPGGAGLAAILLAGDGAPVTLITALARDSAGHRLAAMLIEAGVELVDLGLTGNTPSKIRIRAGGRSLVRLDDGGEGQVEGSLPLAVRTALDRAAAVLVSDYGRGVAASPPLRSALTRRGGVPLVWDPHPRGAAPLAGATLATPNAAEAAGAAPGIEGVSLSAVCARGRTLAARWDVGAVAITLAERGAMLVTGGSAPPLLTPALPVSGGDACGAGDRFAASAVEAFAAGRLPSEAVAAATRQAGEFVAAGGSASVHPPGGGPADRGQPSPRATDGGPPRGKSDGRAVAAAVRARGGTIVATGGCFDLLHAGHVEVLRAARSLGDCLVVCLNSDDSVRRLKGPDRPLVGAADRAAVLRGLDSVDAVMIFDEDTPARLLADLRPDIFAKGGDYAVAHLPEAGIVASWGGQAVVLPYLAGRSTSTLIREAVRRGSS
ncbi:D-glycero-beta-D-manno-heptose 1-phosphate adenylyltransferase [Parafrankia elaeagni]|uniref:D-glycero-beta-D-manno-heptose 1-phosphate adenylyltransferase n=1 Tax=Parafrankia elaeagni TaxID=222534 RepID=UPI00037BA997|nr:D-glycero-beta-D-manno-heptose 1-phosphate adenylyltransferase [Parafrankia elaeagni]